VTLHLGLDLCLGGGGGGFSPLSLDPVLWLKLNEGSGTTPQDSSGNGNNSTFINTPTWDTPGWLDFQAADMDGLLISGLLGQPAAVTVAVWVDVDAIAGTHPRVMSIGNAVDLVVESNGIQVIHFDGGFRSLAYTGGTIVGAGPTHIACVVDPGGSRQQLYLNGVSVASAALSAAINYPGTGISDTYVGQIIGLEPFDGRMHDVLAFPSALTTEQIAAVMAATA
jgi:hypothetical protein